MWDGKIMDDHNANIEIILDKYENVTVTVQLSKLHFGFSQDHLSLWCVWYENLGLGAAASQQRSLKE